MDTLELSLSDQLLTQEDVVKWVERLCWTDMKGKGGTKLTVDREQVLPGSLCYVTRKWRGHWLKRGPGTSGRSAHWCPFRPRGSLWWECQKSKDISFP